MAYLNLQRSVQLELREITPYWVFLFPFPANNIVRWMAHLLKF